MGMNQNRREGFTLIEVMIALSIIGIVMGSVYSVMDSQRKAASMQSEAVDMQQSVRSALYYMEREIRLAGYPSDPARVTGTGIIEAGPGHIRVAMDIFDGIDNNADGQIDEWNENESSPPGTLYNNGTVTEFNEDITYGFEPAYDALGVGLVDAGKSPPGTDPGAAPLGRADFNKPPLPAALKYYDLAESIEAIGFAYAFDNDNDGQLDTGVPGGAIIWAVDTNGDGLLDRNLDTNGDGVIDVTDAPAGVALATPVPIANIRAVQVWLLARSKHKIPEHRETRTFIVGNKRIVANDNYMRRLLSTTIKLRN
jgi:prepilin-type N-terminal cleavage/methylation domain-containing protein